MDNDLIKKALLEGNYVSLYKGPTFVMYSPALHFERKKKTTIKKAITAAKISIV